MNRQEVSFTSHKQYNNADKLHQLINIKAKQLNSLQNLRLSVIMYKGKVVRFEVE